MVKDMFDALQRWAQQVLLRHVVPICKTDSRGHTQGHGTGLLVEKDGCHYLVTAEHVLEPIESGHRLFFPSATLQERTVAGHLLASKEFDIAVLRLTGDGQPPYPDVDKASIAFVNLKPTALPRHGKEYFITGFPARRTKTHLQRAVVEVEPLGHRAPSIDDDTYSKLALDPRNRIALRFDVKSVLRPAGTRQPAPDPQGLSGSPV